MRLLFCGFMAFAASVIPFFFEPRPAVFIFLVVFGTTWYFTKPSPAVNEPISRRYDNINVDYPGRRSRD